MDKPRILVASEEENQISRNLLIWLNKSPEIPETVDAIKYEGLKDAVGMSLSLIQGTYITARYIMGGYMAEYQFKLEYRIKPGDSMDKRLKADETLNRLGDWASMGKPDLGEGIRVVKVEVTARSVRYAEYEDGFEDHQILMKMTYERM